MESKMYEKLDNSVNSCVDFVYEMDIKLKRIVSSLECIVKENDIGSEDEFNMELMLNNETMWKKFNENIIVSFEKYIDELLRQSNIVAEIELSGLKFLEKDALSVVKNATDVQIKIVESIHDLVKNYSEYIMSLEKCYKNNLDEEWLNKAKEALQESILTMSEFYNNEYAKNIKNVNEEVTILLKSNKR